ncbi:MAG: hypothetical protein K2O70_04550, partial [Desulfovibrionaceae bacterium]|nr:hypothetical protein [Desulfovibrionaceae bacterium]
NLCVTAGCSLFQDFTVAGVSMWWFGAAAFTLLCILSLVGSVTLGVVAAGLCLFLDVLLLVLMLLTVPCVGCLFAALLFALSYMAFRHGATPRDKETGRSVLLWIWLGLFLINVGAVVRAQAGSWAMRGPEDASVRMYFSPSCSVCREGVNALSGRVNVAFYPVAENSEDVLRIAAMIRGLEDGNSMSEALKAAQKEHATAGFLEGYSPDMLLLRFRLLCNKAHIFASGGQSVPFFEYHGLPSSLTEPAGQRAARSPASSQQSTDYTLPIEPDVAGSCGGPNAAPCP